jgi:uncharacterized protein with HEPN domain
VIKDDRVYLDHIIESLSKIDSYSKNLKLSEFVANTMVQDALIRQFEVIGEAAKNLSKTLRSNYPDIDWAKIAGMRNKLIHEYFDIDLNILWDSIQDDVPVLNGLIIRIIEDLDKP